MNLDHTEAATTGPLTPIRVETGLTRYPIHRLAKHGDIAIDIREKNADGEVSIKWEVNHNSKYGQPGPLAYKLDTIIINRRIEEAARPIPRIIRLGGLTDICRELGKSSSGGNTNQIKKSLTQNALVGITARIRYKRPNGSEQSLEAVFTRYNVVFTGEKLPDGRKADAVYIVLSDIYMQVINGAMTRPLDYDYLKSLSPASQRFYELLSFQMYATIKNDRPRAKLLYSEFCKYAPLVRQSEWDQVRPQMAGIHAPHKKSGYIARIDFQDASDSDGKPDWIMLYQPGPKARAEYRAFTKRGGPVMLEVEPLMANPLPLLPKPEPSPLESELIARRVSPAVAAELVQQFDADRIMMQIEHLDWLAEKKPGKIAEPGAWLCKAIRSGIALPKAFVSKAERERQAEAKREKDRQAAEERRRKEEAQACQRHEQKLIDARWKEISDAGQEKEHMAAAVAQADPDMLALTQGPMRKYGLNMVRERYIRRLLQAEGKIPPDQE